MRKILLIARREYLHNIRKRSFLFAAFGVPVLVVGMMALSFALTERQETATGGLGDIGYVDLSVQPRLTDPQAEASQEIWLVGPEVETPEEYVPFASEAKAEAAFRAGEIGAYFVITEDYWSTGLVEVYSTKNVPEGIKAQMTDFLREHVSTYAPPQYAKRLSNPVNVTLRNVGGGLEFTEDSGPMLFFLPIIFGMLFMMATMTTAQFLMLGVVDEKENRIMEILVTSCTPEQMLWGKVLGLGSLGLTQVLIWGAGGLLALQMGGKSSPLAGLRQIPPSYAVILLVYFVLGYLFYGSVMAGVGASVTAEQEGRQLYTLFSFVTVLPIMLGIAFVENPNGAIPVFLSLFPFTAPVAMLMRLPLAAVPLGQLLLSFALLGAAMVAAIWISAKVFRLGMLMYGKRLRLGDVITVVRSGMGRPAIVTMASGEEGEGKIA